MSEIPSILKHLQRWRKYTWVILGKGPTFARRGECDLDGLYRLGLNHVVREIAVELAHFTDLDAFLECADSCRQWTGTSVVLPWHPHVRNRPGKETLAELCQEIKPLGQLQRQSKLYSYNSTLASKLPAAEHLPTIPVRLFSAVAGLNLLAEAGVKKIRLLGVDGGNEYSPEFSTHTLLANGRRSFDAQFGEMRKTIAKAGLDCQHLLLQELP